MFPEFKPPDWCSIKYTGIAESIIGAAKLSGAKLCSSISLTFDLPELEIVNKYLDQFGKRVLEKKLVKLCQEAVGSEIGVQNENS